MTRQSYILLALIGIVFLSFGATGLVFTQSSPPPPRVLTAVAPVFVPFVFGKTGTNTVTVRVEISAMGDVTSAQMVNASELRVKSVEDTARQWKFTPMSESLESRTVDLTFVFSLLPKGTQADQLTTIYKAPYQIEVRHEEIERQIIYDLKLDKTRKRPRGKPMY